VYHGILSKESGRAPSSPAASDGRAKSPRSTRTNRGSKAAAPQPNKRKGRPGKAERAKIKAERQRLKEEKARAKAELAAKNRSSASKSSSTTS